jgi:hypothetical protein
VRKINHVNMLIANLFNAVIPSNCRTTNPLSPLNERIKPNTYYLLAELSPENGSGTHHKNGKDGSNTSIKLLLLTRNVVPRDSFNALCRPELYRFERRDDNNIQYKLKQIHIADSNTGLLLSIGNFDNLLIYKSYLNNNRQRCRTIQQFSIDQPRYKDYFQNPNLRSHDSNGNIIWIISISISIIMLMLSLLIIIFKL